MAFIAKLPQTSELVFPQRYIAGAQVYLDVLTLQTQGTQAEVREHSRFQGFVEPDNV